MPVDEKKTRGEAPLGVPVVKGNIKIKLGRGRCSF
jgi:hypothetical protein